MKLSGMPIQRGFSVRLMSPLGQYPADSLHSDSASLIVTPELCFSVVRVMKKHWSYSEVDSLDPIDIPLFGALLLAGHPGDQHLYPYPTFRAVALETEGYEPMDASHIVQCREFLLSQLSDERYQ
jgi:hypothetical protein